MGKYDVWANYFGSLDEADVTLSVGELERALGSPLPPSARRYAAWWSSAQHHARWVDAGFVASPHLAAGEVRFRRQAPRQGRPGKRSSPPSGGSGGTGDRLILLGCVSQKRPYPAPARELYASPMWEKRRGYAEASGQPWAILSAEYGLVMPDQVIEPYDRALKHEPAGYRSSWSRDVATAVVALCRREGLDTVEAHAGAAYLESGLLDALRDSGIRVSRPLRSLRFGEQLSWYDTPVARDAAPLPEPPDPPPLRVAAAPTAPTIVEMRSIGPFTYTWPDAVEDFEHGWEGTCRIGERSFPFRHGLGRRHAYGQDRARAVTWLGGQPMVEGVAADDHAHSAALLSLVRLPDRSFARARRDLPSGYEAFIVVNHRDEIDAPYSRDRLAVKLRGDDVAGWLRHAAHRLAATPSPRTSPPPREPAPPPPPSQHLGSSTAETERPAPAEAALPLARKRTIAAALVEFGRNEGQLKREGRSVEFTDNPEANELLADDPFAFLVAVIADQGIKAERAWALPLVLRSRLGHLDPRLIELDPEAVHTAFAQPPLLHRFVRNVADWTVAAAARVLRDYGGDAARIWNDEPTAVALQERLRAFDGIGQKKAAMAVEILERDLGVPVREMDGSDIAYDVHIRRVFLRTGLAEVDDLDHMIEIARVAYPDRPGAIDLPAWIVGRTWCRPGTPDCPLCALTAVCEKRIGVASSVRGI